MKTMLRRLVRTMPARPGFWVAGTFPREGHPVADNAIAAWSEFMGRDAAELWVAATSLRETGTAQASPNHGT